MNERIKELAEEAGYLPDMFGIGHWNTPECIKFAELIITECANIVYRTCQDGDVGAQAILYEFDIDNARSQK